MSQSGYYRWMLVTRLAAQAEKESRAAAGLKPHLWARSLLDNVERQRSEGFLFELRDAYEIVRAGASATYEAKTVGNSTVDFCITSEKASWNVELVTIEMSMAVKDATVRESAPGMVAETMLLGRGLTRIDGAALTVKQCPEFEVLRVMGRIEDKLLDRKSNRPIKFPLPTPRVFNMLLVDMRHFEGFGHPDRDHCRQVVDGPRLVQYAENRMTHYDGTPIYGLWNEANVRPAARLARERLHVLAFVHEEDFSDDEIRAVTVFFQNRSLECDSSTYPLRWVASDDSHTALRQANSLWKNG